LDTHHINWFHSIDLNGFVTSGVKSISDLNFEADLYFSGDIARGKSVLDIGAWDGFMSFEAERRGAARVVASDYFCWDGPGWGTQDGFNFARQQLGSKVEDLKADIGDLDPSKHGIFDVVLLPGVIYHLTDPWGGIKKAADMTRETLIIETATSMNDRSEPAMQYWVGDSLHGDPTNFWTPNEHCLRAMLMDMGFSRVDTILHNRGGGRLVARAWR
jgi:tRNA (mo5U34)-methyltransferase